MKIKTFPLIICRTPAFSLSTNLLEVWDELKEKIKESSPTFYDLLKNISQDEIHLLPDKTQFTLWKYFNRAQYRSTPFASFAAISTLPLAQIDEPVFLSGKMIKHHFIDWNEKGKYISQKLNSKTILLTNASVYKVGDEIRYIWFVNEHFELASAVSIPEMAFVLDQCIYKNTLGNLYQLLETRFGLKKTHTLNFIKQLISLQLIITDHAPNITGEDYFKRLKIKAENQSEDYIIAGRKLHSGALASEKLKQIPAMIDFFQRNSLTRENQDLQRFKNAFLKKFEHRSVSLAIVMDPEIGIGYGNLEQMNEEDGLINELRLNQTGKTKVNSSYSKLHSFLLNKISLSETIKLDEFTDSNDHRQKKLPNTFSVMTHFFRGNPVIVSAGGCTANALIGRFTLASETLANYGKDIAELEARVNPHVAFFDIAYEVENHIDNINRRKQLYPYELPMLTYSTSDSPLNLNDILVSVQRDEIMLFSKKLKKRLVPRIPSAYNYTRSDLAAYRFLCDLQNQDLEVNLNFKLSDFFNGLSYYPRVCFQDIILFPATWLLPKNFHDKKISYSENLLLELKQWLQSNRIVSLFKTGLADHTLTFDPDKDDDLKAFLNYCNQFNQTELYITEALITTKDVVMDEHNQIYTPQYIVNYYHENQVYGPMMHEKTASRPPSKTDIKLPGEDWLYFDIYTHPSRSNGLLLNEVKQHLQENRTAIAKWFFIRYTDPSAHLRLRLQLKTDAPGFIVIRSLMNLIKPQIMSGLVTDFGIKTYYRETHRYGSERMDLVEKFFYQDSVYIIRLLTKAKENDQLYANSVLLFSAYCAVCFSNIADQLAFAKKVASGFATEMNIAAHQFRKINAAYNEFSKNINQLATAIPKNLSRMHHSAFLKVIKNCNNQIEKEKMLADLFHMHVNRLFINNQRMHETVIYHYLVRRLQTQKALSADE